MLPLLPLSDRFLVLDRINAMADNRSMEWDVTLNAAFYAWFNPIEEDVQNEVLATLLVLVELGPDFVQRRLDFIKLVAGDARHKADLEGLSKKYDTEATLSDYLKEFPETRRGRIEARAAEIRAEGLADFRNHATES